MIGRKVMVIFSNPGYSCADIGFPPVGALGEIISDIDKHDEYDVIFFGYPCPTLDDPSWVTHKNMIVYLGDDHAKSESAVKNINLAIAV